MIRKNILLAIMLLCPVLIIAQVPQTESVNFRKLGREIKKKKSPFYYPRLYQRYLDLDTNLTIEEFRYLYFGFTFHDEYRPYAEPLLRDSLIRYLQREDPLPQEVALSARIAGDLLQDSPFRLRETFIAAVSYEMAGNTTLSKVYFNFFEKQVSAIMSTGDGLSRETAFVVIYIPDEYEILEVLGFKHSGSQQLIDGQYDLIRVAPNPYGVYEMFFNVERMIKAGNQ